MNETWRSGWRRFVHLAVLVALVYTHFIGWLYILTISLTSLFVWVDRERRRFWLEQVAMASAVFLPWLIIFGIVYLRRSGLEDNLNWLAKPDMAAVLDAAGKIGWFPLWLAGGWGAIRAWKDVEHRELAATFALCVLAPPLVLLGISTATSTLSFFHPRYVSASIPFLALLAGMGLLPLKSRVVRVGFMLLVLGMAIYTGREMRVPQRPDFSAIARELNGRCPDLPVLHANEFSLARPLQYHGVSRNRLRGLGSANLESGPALVVWKPERRREESLMGEFLNRTGGHEVASIDFPSRIAPAAFVRITVVEPEREADGAGSSSNTPSCLPPR
jgi:hypothetical protein